MPGLSAYLFGNAYARALVGKLVQMPDNALTGQVPLTLALYTPAIPAPMGVAEFFPECTTPRHLLMGEDNAAKLLTDAA